MFEHQVDSFPKKEETILDFWAKNEIFKKSIDQRRDSPLFSFYDGPPFATGLPHYGHILAGTIKDVVPRYKAMKGFKVPRRFGWDCHGLPVENEIEKAKELSGASAIETYGIAAFNEECRSIVFRYVNQWKSTVERMGRWVDFDQTYQTMDLPYMESVWWVFGELYKKGLIYEGFKVMPFSAQLGTPLSNFEANLNYKDVDDPSLTVRFSLKHEPSTQLLVWTTTPWTLPSNLAILARKDLIYVKIHVKSCGSKYILAKECLHRYLKEDEFEILESFPGERLENYQYVPLFPYFQNRENAFFVILDECVSSEDGTGLVHAAPAFGEVDFFACSRKEIELVCPVDHNGRFTKEVVDFEGLYVKDADKEIIKKLKKEGKIFHHGQIRHRYPFCWRSDTPLIYKAVTTWFVSVEKIKELLVEVNEKIHWVPSHIQQGRFGKWLESARDWAISRNRYWGTPIPIWRSLDGEVRVISSKQELEEKTGTKTEDLHRHFIDDLCFQENGKIFRRIPEVFDCWFESGSMPYAQNHHPFANKSDTVEGFPADFIAEGVDQTRGWFYTLTVLAAALFEKPAFKNVIVNGIILAEDGTKMSKRLKNYPEPTRMFNEYGADALRLYLIQGPAVQAEDLRFSERGVELMLRQTLIPFWNSYLFLATYAKIDQWQPKLITEIPALDIDRWILSRLQKMIEQVSFHMDRYELNLAIVPWANFIDDLTDWYIRRNRSRFWSDKGSQGKEEAFSTLYTAVLTLCKVSAPFIPFLSETIYRELRTESDPISVHLTNYPTATSSFRDTQLEDEMSFVQTVVSSGHSLRKEHRYKVRQPLAKAFLVSSNPHAIASLKKQSQLVCEELNVKEIYFETDETKFVKLSVKPNFRVLGKKVGSKMSLIQKQLQELSYPLLEKLMHGSSIELSVENDLVVLTPEDVTIERSVIEGTVAQSSGELTVVLDLTLSPELIEEGLARELINKINTLRKELNFSVEDRIEFEIQESPALKKCIHNYKDYIFKETLTISCDFKNQVLGHELDLNSEVTYIKLTAIK